MGERVYCVNFENVTVAAAQDLISLKAGSANGIKLHHLMLSAGGVSAAAELRIRLKRMPATFTQGSGGSAGTIQFVDSGDTKASTVTARTNDTTQGTTSGTAAILLPWQWNVLNFFEHLPVPDDREECAATEGFVLDVTGTVASTVISGFAKWEENP
jgi:hypothetical protein